MAISVFDLFSIGIGPSSSHTVGPMRAAQQFASKLADDGLLAQVARVKTDLYGSLGATGKGHGSDKAVMLGLEGEVPESVDTDSVDARMETIRSGKQLNLFGVQAVRFNEKKDLVMHRRESLPFHSNGMTFRAFDSSDTEIRKATFYSVGGGFIIDESAEGAERIVAEHGHSGLSARKVASAIGYTVGTLYLVFDNLDDLVLQVRAIPARKSKSSR